MKTDCSRHRPFADGKFSGLKDSILNSPYPWHYTLRWPWYFFNPSTRKHSNLSPLPDSFGNKTPITSTDNDIITVVFAGDIMPLNGDRAPELCEQLRHLIHNADLFVANLEAPLGDHPPDHSKRNTFRFHMPTKFFEQIQQQIGLPFSQLVINNANNHSGDAGIAGFDQSVEILERLGVQHLGHKSFTDPFRVIECKGLRIGFAGWSHWLNRNMESTRNPMVSIKHILESAPLDYKKKNKLDILFGLPHWEYEFQHYPKEETRELAKNLLKYGFDLLVGSHPHVLQPYELFNEKPCFYSLGNFCGLGVAKPVKIIPLLELQLRRNSGSETTEISYFELHYFYQLHDNEKIKIVPINNIAPDLYRTAVQRLSKVVTLNRHRTKGAQV